MTNRIIKFRAWTGKEMAFVISLGFEKGGTAKLNVKRPVTSHAYGTPTPYWPFSKIKLMQFTGLNDKNGKEIYEGDIIKDGWLKDNPLAVVEWSGTGFEPFADHAITEGDPDPNTYEVIGNIYEDSHLLSVDPNIKPNHNKGV